jgi:Ca-activated chloride channel family protein
MKNLLAIALILLNSLLFAQPKGHLKGSIQDHESNKAIAFADVALQRSGKTIDKVTANLKGEFYFLKVDAGEYELSISSNGYQSKLINSVWIQSGDTTFIDIRLEQMSLLQPTVIAITEEEQMEYQGAYDMRRAKSSKRYINSNILTSSYPYDNRNEDYQELNDNHFKSPLTDPLSTFSADVDRAAYANIRRYLNDQAMPPEDAVRIEEMINYFDYDYPEPKGDHPFSITTELADCPWDKNRKLAMIGLQAKRMDLSETPANNLVFLLDVSGSMNSYNKLGLLKEGMLMLVDQMREEDHISIVVYAGAAGLVLEPTSGDQKAEIKAAIDQLSAGGSTAGGEGIELAYQVAQKNFKQEGNNRIILATDGDFNVGITNRKELIALIEAKRASGVFLSVLGFGTGNIKDHVMEQLADKGNGNYNYIDNILEAKKVLVKEISGTLFTVAKDVKLQAEFNPETVMGYRLIGYVNRQLAAQDFNDDTKDAGELGAGHSVTAIYEIIPAGADMNMIDIDSLKYQKKRASDRQANENELLTVKFRYKQPNGNKSTLLESVLEVTDISFEQASTNFRFASTVAAFGMKLRGSESMKNMNYDQIITLAKAAKGQDEEGYRAEFIKLVETAQLLERAEK